MANTSNLGLEKPDRSDFADVAVINSNMEKIDAKFPGIGNKTILNAVYPVGSIYMSVANTNPGTLFGGTWVQLENRFLIGAGTNYVAGNTGGNTQVTLTENQLPSHNHSMAHTHSMAHQHTAANGANHGFATLDTEKDIYNTSLKFAGKSTPNAMYHASYTALSQPTNANTGEASTQNTGAASIQNTGNKGGGAAVSILPPYLAVYMWKRIA